MKSKIGFIWRVFFTLYIASVYELGQAEIVSQLTSDIAFPAATLGSKSAVIDMMNKKRFESANDLLTQNGFDTHLDKGEKAKGLIAINNLRVPVLINGERKMVDLINLNDFKDLVIPAAIKDLKQASADATKSVPVTGGMIGVFGLLGWAANQAFDAKREADIPLGVVVVNAQIMTTRDKEKQAKLADVVVTVASDQNESPAALFDAAVRKLVEVFMNGYTLESGKKE